MKYSGIGGQAVMEGVMMKNQDKYAVAVRKPNKEIETNVWDYKAEKSFAHIRKLPVFRGVFNFIDSLYLGMSTLMYSSSFFEDEEEKPSQKEGLSEDERSELEAKEKKQEKAMMGGMVVFSVIMALAIFFALPYFLSIFFQKFIESTLVITLIEGIIRLAIFIAYIALISLMPDIKRTFMYHGAEHKCINCIEHGLELNVENVRKSSRLHKRCGTSFLLIVMCISIVFFTFALPLWNSMARSNTATTTPATNTPHPNSVNNFTIACIHARSKISAPILPIIVKKSAIAL